MRLVSARDYEGIRLYRSPSEIRDDIAAISERVGMAELRLSIHEILARILTGADRCPDTNESIAIIESGVADSRAAIRKMERLTKSLDDLILELEEARWAHGA